MSKGTPLTARQLAELSNWACRLTSEEYQDRRGLLCRVTNPKQDIGSKHVSDTPFDRDSFTLQVDYSLKLEGLVRLGTVEYAKIADSFTSKNFPTTRTGSMVLEGGRLVSFNHAMITRGVEKELDKMGLRPGEPHELCAFGEKFPDEVRDQLIVALGGQRWKHPSFEATMCVAILRSWDTLGRLAMDTIIESTGWSDNCQFLAFPR